MSSRYLLFLALLVAFLHLGAGQLFAQIPNAGFENWTGGNPDGWSTSNESGFDATITQTSASHSGTSAVEGIVGQISGFPWPPFLASGSDNEGFPVNARHAALHGWYKFNPLGSDQIAISVGMTLAGTAIGAGGLALSDAQSTYREFVVNIDYLSSEVPDTCFIYIGLSGSGGFSTIGSTYVIDDLSFGTATSVTQNGNVIPESYGLSQNYPNPFNPTTWITYAIPEADQVRLAVFNPLGQEVALLADGNHEPGNYRVEFDGAGLPSGMYFYRLQAGEFSQVRKLMLVK